MKQKEQMERNKERKNKQKIQKNRKEQIKKRMDGRIIIIMQATKEGKNK